MMATLTSTVTCAELQAKVPNFDLLEWHDLGGGLYGSQAMDGPAATKMAVHILKVRKQSAAVAFRV